MKSTKQKDKNGNIIKLGDRVNIHANPYHGEYEVKFGEYQLEPFMKHQIEVPHLGFYLTNGKNIISFMNVIRQPKGHFASTHSIEILTTPKTK